MGACSRRSDRRGTTCTASPGAGAAWIALLLLIICVIIVSISILCLFGLDFFRMAARPRAEPLAVNRGICEPREPRFFRPARIADRANRRNANRTEPNRTAAILITCFCICYFAASQPAECCMIICIIIIIIISIISSSIIVFYHHYYHCYY